METSNPLYRTQKLVASTTAFQNWCGVSTYADAKGRTHVHIAQIGATRPFALIEWGEDRTLTRYGIGYVMEANVTVSFINTSPEETEDNINGFDEAVMGIVQEMGELAGTSDHILFDSMTWQGWTVVPVDQGEDVIWSVWNCSGPNWGVSDV